MDILKIAEYLDAFRVVPRMILLGYGFLIWEIVAWFMTLPEPNSAQSALVVTMIGASAAVIGLYNNSGRSWLTNKIK